MGNRPAPTAIKKARGDRKSRIATNEPILPIGCPLPPDHVIGKAREYWLSIGPILEQMGTVTMADALAVERLSSCYAELVTLDEDIRINGLTQKTETVSGAMLERQRPQVAMRADADRRFKMYLVEFGLTPASRSGVSRIEKKEDKTGFDI